MFARNVSIRLKPNTLPEFIETFEKYVLPLLRQQPGFRDEITLAAEGGTHVTALSIWDSKEQADKCDRSAYYLNKLGKVLDGTPKVRVSTVINSTFHNMLWPQRPGTAAGESHESRTSPINVGTSF
jgi:Antibiotic biosynthesis monooxygenase